jgi:hypothetical protein
MTKQERRERHNTFQGHGGSGFAGPLVAPPWGGSAEGDAGGL